MYRLSFLFLLLCGSLMPLSSFAGPGDTLRVQSHNAVRMTWYGNYDRPAQLPSDTVRYRKALLHLTLGCGGQACSQWDYTTQIFLLHPTGVMDSTVTPAPDFKVNGSVMDTACYNLDTTYVYFYDSLNQTTDSVAAGLWTIRFYNDPNNLFLATDSLFVWPGNYWNYIFDSNGNRVDSNWVGADSCLYISYDTLYTPFQVHDPYELARVITPYAGGFPNNWSFTWTYDITDFAPLLHDSVGIRAFYSGWSDGFAVSLDFEFIEGIPPRDSREVRRLWNGNFNYGSVSNPIENYLPARVITLDTASKQAMIHVNTTGHGFGGNQNCAEFCRKVHTVVTGSQNLAQDLWRPDCDLNPLFPQAGNFLPDRAGWCPGSEVRPFTAEAGNEYTPGQPLSVDYNMAAYTYTGGGNHPVYTIEAYLFGYSAMNHTLDAEVYDIFSPSLEDPWGRMNPNCMQPAIVIRNAGSTALSSASIEYGIQGGTLSQYNWSGSLAPMQKDTVYLPQPSWSGIASTGNVFVATISAPNGGADAYAANNSRTSVFNAAPVYPNRVILNWKSNNQPYQTSYKLYDQAGTLLYQNTPFLTAATVYNDTFVLAQGCYRLYFKDMAEDGLYNYFSNQGTGYAMIKNGNTGANLITLPADFGGDLSHYFRVETGLGSVEPVPAGFSFSLYPNPSQGELSLRYAFPETREFRIGVFDLTGNLVWQSGEEKGISGEMNIHLEGLAAGIYQVRLQAGEYLQTEKLVLIR